ncbi:MAG: 50S ribosomal protein L1 [Candidatus Micrarchaeia archaeon]
MIKQEELLSAINTCLSEKRSRKFVQSVELIVNFRGIDFSKAENRLNMDVFLPKGRGRQVKIVVFADGAAASEAKKAGADMIIGGAEIAKQEKSKIKKMVKDWEFVVQPSLMMAFGKNFGQILGGRGKTPRPLVGNPAPMFNMLRNSVRLRNRGKNLPTIHTIIGTEIMEPTSLAENAMAILTALSTKFGDYAIKSVFVKLSMGKPCKVGESSGKPEGTSGE